MRKTITIVLMTALFAALILTGCGKKAVFGVTTDEDNTIRVTAEKGPAERTSGSKPRLMQMSRSSCVCLPVFSGPRPSRTNRCVKLW